MFNSRVSAVSEGEVTVVNKCAAAIRLHHSVHRPPELGLPFQYQQ